MIEIKLVDSQREEEKEVVKENKNKATFVIPGDVITDNVEYIRGHGTYLKDADDTQLKASVAGVVSYADKLITVHPQKSRYEGHPGEVVVGRILEVGYKKWKVDVKGKLSAVLPLSSIFLPGNENRRKSEEDEKWMREYLDEGDLISAEVQSVYRDGSLCLNARSLKFGKLGQGVLVKVAPALVRKQYKNTHFHTLSCGVSLILGCNGFVWVYPTASVSEVADGGRTQNLEPMSRAEHEAIARVRNCLHLMSNHHCLIYEASIDVVYEASLSNETKDLLKACVSESILERALITLENMQD